MSAYSVRSISLLSGVCIYISEILILATVVGSIGGRFFHGEWAPTPFVAFAVVLCLIPLIWMPQNIDRPSKYMYWILYLVIYIPCVIIPYYGLTSYRAPATVIPLSVTLFFSLFILNCIYQIPLVRLFPHPQVTWRYFWLILITGTVGLFVVTSITINTYGFFDFSNRHHVRAAYSATVTSLGPVWQRIVGYSMTWLRSVFLPITLVSGIIYRKKFYIIFGVIGYLLTYLQTGFRSSIILPIAIIGISVIVTLMNERRNLLIQFSIFSMTIIIGIFLFGYTILNISLPIGIMRRTFLIQGLVTGYYYDFFSHHQFIFLTDHIYGRLFAIYPYDLQPPYLIGKTYFNKESMAASVNLFGRGFASFGLLGIIGYTAVLAMALYLYDSAADHIHTNLGILFLFGETLAITNTGILTVLINGGLLILILVVYIFPNTESQTI